MHYDPSLTILSLLIALGVAWLAMHSLERSKMRAPHFVSITGHKDVALPRGRKDDPSANFSYARLREEVAKALHGTDAPAPQPRTAPTPTPQPSIAPQPPAFTAPVAGVYTVVQGDTLWAIARRTLGEGNRWKEIFELNRDTVANANLIYPGQTLRLPGASTNAPLSALQQEIQTVIAQLDGLLRG